jgi:heme exporter protein D
MNASSLEQFLSMGGYGLYVWGSFGMCTLVIALELALIAQRRRALAQTDEDAAPALTPEAGA